MTATTEAVLVDAVVQALKLPATGTVNASAGNTGNGIVQGLRVGPPAVLGIYTLTFSDATNYSVAKPSSGPVIGTGVVGSWFNAGGIRLAVAAGDVAFIAGDAFAVTVLPPTNAIDRVYSPRDWPVKPARFPVISVRWHEDDKESMGANAPAFYTTTVVRVVGRVAALPEEDDAGAAAARLALGILKRQIEVAVINNYALTRIISEFASVSSRQEIKNEGQEHEGELTMDFALKYQQGTEDFAPVLYDQIREIAIYADLANVASPTGEFTPPFPYAVTDSPRTQGPDGRVEAAALIELET